MEHLICLRCGHTFSNKANLNKHYRRKTICQDIYYNYDYKYLKDNHNILKGKRIELLVYNYKPIKKVLKKPSIILYNDIQKKIEKLDSEVKESYQKIFKCHCGKVYIHQSSLSRHKKVKHAKKETLFDKLIKRSTKLKKIPV